MKKTNPLWKERYKTLHFHGVLFRHISIPSSPSFFGIIVKKKVGNAVLRNRIKRRLRSAFHHHNQGTMHHKAYIAVVQDASFLEIPFDQLKAHIQSIK